MKYMISNIKFELNNEIIERGSVITLNLHKYSVDLTSWLEDVDIHPISVDNAYRVCVRTMLFYRSELLFDFVETDETVNENTYQDLCADMIDDETSTRIDQQVKVDWPETFLIDTDTCYLTLEESDNEIAQHIFSTLLEQLPVTVKLIAT
ncbi:hypothetical protein D3C79_627870 [compost metagenome]